MLAGEAENHAYVKAIYFMYYNFVRIHQTLKIEAAIAAGLTERLWEVNDIGNVLEGRGLKNANEKNCAF